MRRALVLGALFAACGGDDGGGSGTIGAGGGSVSGGGVELVFPAGALAADTEISIAESGEEPDGFTLASPVFRFSPEGLDFAAPVEVRIDADDAEALLYWSAASGTGFDLIASTRDGDTLVGAIDHFSLGFAARAGSTGDLR